MDLWYLFPIPNQAFSRSLPFYHQTMDNCYFLFHFPLVNVYLRSQVFSCWIPTDTFHKSFVFINLFHLLCIDMLALSSISLSLLPNVLPSQTIINPSTPQEAKYWLSFDQAKSCTSIQKFNFPVWIHFDWVYQIHVLLNILQVSTFHNLFHYYQIQILLLHFYTEIDWIRLQKPNDLCLHISFPNDYQIIIVRTRSQIASFFIWPANTEHSTCFKLMWLWRLYLVNVYRYALSLSKVIYDM